MYQETAIHGFVWNDDVVDPLHMDEIVLSVLLPIERIRIPPDLG